MKNKIVLAIFLAFALGMNGFAAPQVEESSNNEAATCESAPAPDADQETLQNFLDEKTQSAEGQWGANPWGYWHCTAYPPGHGHHFGFQFFHHNYNRAYYGAMMRCERATGRHCHHIHCHFDHH